MPPPADDDQPTRAQIDATAGPVVVEFGAAWCGHCRVLGPKLAKVLAEYPELRHIKVEDGPGLPLGRSYGVKLWPTLVFLRDGAAIRRLVRPADDQLRQACEDVGSDREG